VQPAAAAQGDLPAVTSEVQREWLARIAAEYTSAAIAHQLTLWLIQAGAPPDLIDAGLATVADELAHSRLSHEVYTAAGGTAPPAIDQTALGLPRTSPRLEVDILRATVRVFCLGETVAVPLFAHLREHCTEPVAREALDRILRDEVRHRDFGWDLLDWLQSFMPDTQKLVGAELPAMLAELISAYGPGGADLPGADDDRAWGLAPARDYARILERCVERDLAPRFAARHIALPATA
jgi:hypothetical protein